MADEQTTPPMSDERLAEIRNTAHGAGWLWANSDNEAYVLYQPIEELLAEVERLRAALAQEQREHGNCEDYHFRMSQTQLQAMVALAEQNAAMRPIVEAVAKWGIGGGMPVEFYRQAVAFIAAHPTKE